MADDLPLDGRTCVVTDGSRGIGAAVVRRALAQGADVAFGYHRGVGHPEALCAQARAAHPNQRCAALPVEIGGDTAAERFAAEALERLGGGLDILVNNATLPTGAGLGRTRGQRWDEVVESNLDSMFNTTRPFVMPLLRRGRGAVVNITATSGGRGTFGQTAYAASASGIFGFTKALSKEVDGLGVTVNAVAPTLIDTSPRTGFPARAGDCRAPVLRVQDIDWAEDIAALVCFLASDHARHITGQVIEVSGGLTP